MAKEIERKFLVTDDSYRRLATKSFRIVQGYISREPERTVRVRVRDNEGFLTIKGLTQGVERDEWEFQIPHADAIEMLNRVCLPGAVDKTRYIVAYEGYTWEVDEFHGVLSPLVVAEVELEDAACQPSLPPFIGKEVSGDPEYYNSSLAEKCEELLKASPD